MSLLLVGCSIEPVEYSYYEDGEFAEEEDLDESEEITDEEVLTGSKKHSKNVHIDAYARAAEQIMWDWRGKMQARDGFTYIPPVRECGVKVGGYQYGGAFVLPTTTCIDRAPGHYIDESTIYVPAPNMKGDK